MYKTKQRTLLSKTKFNSLMRITRHCKSSKLEQKCMRVHTYVYIVAPGVSQPLAVIHSTFDRERQVDEIVNKLARVIY